MEFRESLQYIIDTIDTNGLFSSFNRLVSAVRRVVDVSGYDEFYKYKSFDSYIKFIEFTNSIVVNRKDEFIDNFTARQVNDFSDLMRDMCAKTGTSYRLMEDILSLLFDKVKLYANEYITDESQREEFLSSVSLKGASDVEIVKAINAFNNKHIGDLIGSFVDTFTNRIPNSPLDHECVKEVDKMREIQKESVMLYNAYKYVPEEYVKEFMSLVPNTVTEETELQNLAKMFMKMKGIN